MGARGLAAAFGLGYAIGGTLSAALAGLRQPGAAVREGCGWLI